LAAFFFGAAFLVAFFAAFFFATSHPPQKGFGEIRLGATTVAATSESHPEQKHSAHLDACAETNRLATRFATGKLV
jgi:hypothetical protein